MNLEKSFPPSSFDKTRKQIVSTFWFPQTCRLSDTKPICASIIATWLRSDAREKHRRFARERIPPLEIDLGTGCMTSLFNKKTRTESLATPDTDTGGPKSSICGNLLQAFQDKPKAWDAWNVDADFEKVHWDITTADEVKLVESGPLRAILRVKQHFQNSTFVRDIIVTAVLRG